MNRFSACKQTIQHLVPVCGLSGLLVLSACGMPESESAGTGDTREYSIHYVLEAKPATSQVRVEMHLRQPAELLRELSFASTQDTRDISGDGSLVMDNGRVRWLPPVEGGTLAWTTTVHGMRKDGSFDARLTQDWGIFRMEDVIPRARTKTLKGATSYTTLEFALPSRWSAVSEYASNQQPLVVQRAKRRFAQPAGWVVMGRLGVRRETIAGTRVAVAAPEGQSVRRLDMLALLNWTLPELVSILPDALPRLTIISAGDPMWRGGLSAPASLFLHADRPLISENATSPLLHEVMHTALGVRPRDGYDWIAEGFAEYYSIELLRRGHAITPERALAALDWQATWSKNADVLCDRNSTAATTALAVTVLAALQDELQNKSDGNASLDDLLPALVGSEVDLSTLTRLSEALIGSTPDALHIDRLPGCLNIE
jgi:hypothetical protein